MRKLSNKVHYTIEVHGNSDRLHNMIVYHA